jgi:hypothetical protein
MRCTEPSPISPAGRFASSSWATSCRNCGRNLVGRGAQGEHILISLSLSSSGGMGRPEKRGPEAPTISRTGAAGEEQRLSLLNPLRNSPAAKAFGLSLPGVLGAVRIPALALACHNRKPGEGGRSTILSREPMLRPFLQSTLKRHHEIRRCR